MLAVKRRQDANKIHPFVFDKDTLDHINISVAPVVAARSTAVSSPSSLLVPALTRAATQDVTSGTAFRRVLPKYEASPSAVVAAKSIVDSSTRIPVFGSSSGQKP